MQRKNKFSKSLSKQEAECELKGLAKLQKACEGLKINIPEARYDGQDLVMDYIQASHFKMQDMFGDQLAKMHQRSKVKKCGLNYDNFIGKGIQKNTVDTKWGDFFFKQRLMMIISQQKDLAKQRLYIDQISLFKNKMVSMLNDTVKEFSLLHGDLWFANVMQDNFGKIWLIDPAIYYGDHEVDIAMTELFDGFTYDFYRGYKRVTPLSSEYENKKRIYNLYHLINHENIFSGGYEKQILQIVMELRSSL
jgi:fructosamine-3-kinase